MVSHEKLLKDLNKTSLPDHFKRWFNCYLHGRQSKVNFRNQTSSSRNIHTGVPQGAVTSPVLFNFYLSNLPATLENIKLIQYADDITVYACVRDLTELAGSINTYVKSLTNFLTERELLVSPEKSTVTLFTPNPAEAQAHPEIYVQEKCV